MHPYLESTVAAYRAARTTDPERALALADKAIALLQLLDDEAELASRAATVRAQVARPDDREAVGAALDSYLSLALRVLARPELGEARRLEMAREALAVWTAAEGRTWRA